MICSCFSRLYSSRCRFNEIMATSQPVRSVHPNNFSTRGKKLWFSSTGFWIVVVDVVVVGGDGVVAVVVVRIIDECPALSKMDDTKLNDANTAAPNRKATSKSGNEAEKDENDDDVVGLRRDDNRMLWLVIIFNAMMMIACSQKLSLFWHNREWNATKIIIIPRRPRMVFWGRKKVKWQQFSTLYPKLNGNNFLPQRRQCSGNFYITNGLRRTFTYYVFDEHEDVSKGF